MPRPIPLLFFKSDIANRPGLALQNVTDKAGHQTKRWKRAAQEMKSQKPVKGPEPAAQARPAGKTPDLQPGHRVKFQAGEHQGQGEITAVGKDGVTVKDASGREHGVHHHELTHHAPAKGEGGSGGQEPPRKPPTSGGDDGGNDEPPEDKYPKSADEIARALFDTSEINQLPSKARQPVESWEELSEKAPQALKEFSGMLNGVAENLRLVTGKRPQSHHIAVLDEANKAEREGRSVKQLPEEDYMLPEDWGNEKGYLFMGPLKGEKRAKEKVEADYEGDWGQVRDMVRATIAVPMVTQLPKVLDELKKAGIELAQQPKNNLVKPLPGGYRDLNLIVKTPSGLLAELQIHVKPMTLAKEQGHDHYETSRTIEAEYKKKGVTNRDEYHPDDQDKHKKAMEEQERLYSAAWEKATGQAPKKDDGELKKSLSAPILILWKRKGKTP